MKRLSRLFLVAVVSVLANVNPVHSAPPSSMSIQGTVADSNQLPVSGNRLYRVRFYDAQTAGTQLGNDFTGSIDLSPSGRFNVEILTPTAILDQSDVWYEVAIDIGNNGSINEPADVFADRVRVNSVPFAMSVDRLINGNTVLDGNGLVTDQSIKIGAGHSVFDAYNNGMDSDSTVSGDGALKFYAGGTSSTTSNAKLTIDNQGYVGIGTENPQRPLDVNGSIQIAIDGAVTDPNNNGMDIGSSGDVEIQSGGGDENVVVKANGYVGIGTKSPQGILHIQGRDVTNFPNSTGIRFSRTTGHTQDWLISTGVAGQSNDYLAIKDITDNEYRMVFDDNGKVGIGTTGPLAKLDVNGDILGHGAGFTNDVNTNQNFRADGQVFSNGTPLTSDQRYKKDITTFKHSIETVKQLRGVKFNWRRDEFVDKHFTQKQQVGVIAQEVEEVLPEVVQTNTDGYKSVDYAKIVPVLIEAIKEQQTLFETQQALINDLIQEIERLKNNQ